MNYLLILLALFSSSVFASESFSTVGTLATKNPYAHFQNEWVFGQLSVEVENQRFSKWTASNYLTKGHQGFTANSADHNYFYTKDWFSVIAAQKNMWGQPIGHFTLSQIEGAEFFSYVGWGEHLQNRDYSGFYWGLFSFGTQETPQANLDELSKAKTPIDYEGSFVIINRETKNKDNGKLVISFDPALRYFQGELQLPDGTSYGMNGVYPKITSTMQGHLFDPKEGTDIGSLFLHPYGPFAQEIGGTFMIETSKGAWLGVLGAKTQV